MAYWNERKLEMYYWAVRILKLSFTRGPVGSTSSACVFAGVGYTVLCQNYTFAEVSLPSFILSLVNAMLHLFLFNKHIITPLIYYQYYNFNFRKLVLLVFLW